MIREGKFGPIEAICLLTITISAKAFYTSPSSIMQMLGPASWYMELIAIGSGVIAFTFVYLLLKRFPGKNLMEIYDISFGKVIGFIFCLILAAWLLYFNAIGFREYIEITKIYNLPFSPISYILALFLTGVVFIGYLGLETLARFAKLVFYLLLGGFVVVLILSSQNYDVCNLFPIYGHGLGKTLYSGASRGSIFGEVILAAVMAKSLQGIKHIKRIGYISIIASGLIITVAILAFTLTFPYTTAEELTAPMYVMVSLPQYSRFFQRLESIFIFTWNLSSMISASALFYGSLMAYCHAFRIQDKRPILLPLSIVFFALTMYPRSITELAYIYIPFFRELGWIFFFIPPVIALITAVLRKKKGAAGNA